MSTKKRPAAAPFDDRRPDPLSARELADAKAVSDARERTKIHRILLTESLRRLRAGRTLEREHGVIHPEMTAIARDVLRLTDLVYPLGASVDGDVEAEPVGQESDGSRAICALLARTTPTRLARLAGVGAKAIVKWSRGVDVPDEDIRGVLEARLKIPREAWGRP